MLEKYSPSVFYMFSRKDPNPKAMKTAAAISNEYLICCSFAVATHSDAFSGGGPKPKKMDTSSQGIMKNNPLKAS